RVARLPVPAAGGRVGDVFVEAPVAGCVAHLPPFARHARGVAGLLESLRQRRLGLERRLVRGLIRPTARAKSVTRRHDLAARRPAQRPRETTLAAEAGG